ncbi:hypothetical protein [Alkalihalobacterium chitinilyticum]|uniref:Uncharacterized protein n=1 Tax=Alkalihalobacterium chitinilyticum TaxID=2980103 RepID=A0ABT5VI70_9BACI|nr:hypothetical protein [Alkalihalobacterium chitinilyticum]MDE5415119.1 hypothetical protein [Alkalihalobacterium chitinilyticum]
MKKIISIFLVTCCWFFISSPSLALDTTSDLFPEVKQKIMNESANVKKNSIKIIDYHTTIVEVEKEVKVEKYVNEQKQKSDAIKLLRKDILVESIEENLTLSGERFWQNLNDDWLEYQQQESELLTQLEEEFKDKISEKVMSEREMTSIVVSYTASSDTIFRTNYTKVLYYDHELNRFVTANSFVKNDLVQGFIEQHKDQLGEQSNKVILMFLLMALFAVFCIAVIVFQEIKMGNSKFRTNRSSSYQKDL